MWFLVATMSYLLPRQVGHSAMSVYVLIMCKESILEHLAGQVYK